MKLHQSTKTQNHTWAYSYMGIAALMIAYASWKGEWVLNIFAALLVGLAGYRLFVLEKKIKGSS